MKASFISSSVLFVNTETDDDMILYLSDILSDTERMRARRFVRNEDHHSYVLAHALKRLVLSSVTGLATQDLKFSCNAFGKPFLLNDNIHFNLSRTRGWVAFAWAKSGAIGVDIEHVAHHTFDENVVKMVLSDAEYASLNLAEDRRTFFIGLWTMKEAVAKADGKGMNMDFRKLELRKHEVMTSTSRWKVKYYYPSTRHIAALAVDCLSKDDFPGYKVLKPRELMCLGGRF